MVRITLYMHFFWCHDSSEHMHSHAASSTDISLWNYIDLSNASYYWPTSILLLTFSEEREIKNLTWLIYNVSLILQILLMILLLHKYLNSQFKSIFGDGPNYSQKAQKILNFLLSNIFFSYLVWLKRHLRQIPSQNQL